MIRLGTSGRTGRIVLAEHSPLRSADPRTKLAIALCASLAVMLPIEHLLTAMAIYIVLLLWAQLLRPAAYQVWRLKWVLLGLFIVDYFFVGKELAYIITLRIILLAGSFTLFFATTAPNELCLALEWFRIPYRYAFSVSLAFQSVGMLDEEWRYILEAQHARGAWSKPKGLKKLVGRLRDLTSLTVPAIVLTTKRAWAMTEAAYARGFDSPHRKPYNRLELRKMDWLLLAATLAVSTGLIVWRILQ